MSNEIDRLPDGWTIERVASEVMAVVEVMLDTKDEKLAESVGYMLGLFRDDGVTLVPMSEKQTQRLVEHLYADLGGHDG